MGSKFLSAFKPSHLIEVIRQPRDHPRELSLLIGMAILLIFALIVLFALLFVKSSRRKKRATGKRLRPATARELVAFLIFFGWLILLSFSASFVLVASPTFCLSCHGNSQVAKDLKSSVHAKLACQDCHQTPGLVGSVSYRLEVGRMVVGQIAGMNANTGGSASRDACLSCHQGIVEKTMITKSIKMKHKEPIDGGYRCEQCHFGLAHNEPKRTVAMSTCFDCHEKGDSILCRTCHTNWAGATDYKLADYAKVNMPSDDMQCNRCHDTDKGKCMSCHKIAMPHSEQWNQGGHAMRGATDRALCAQCHTSGECVKCHPGMPGPHPEGWIKAHGASSKLPKATCGTCHKLTYCQACHSDLTNYKLKTLPDG